MIPRSSGREFDRLTGGRASEPDPAVVASVLARGVMALPCFAPGSGPFPDSVGRWSHDPDGLTAPERHAAASLYAALMTATCLDLLGAAGAVTVEGPFAGNALYLEALGHLAHRSVRASSGRTGTSAGAAALLAAPRKEQPALSVPAGGAGLLSTEVETYAARWRAAIGAERFPPERRGS